MRQLHYLYVCFFPFSHLSCYYFLLRSFIVPIFRGLLVLDTTTNYFYCFDCWTKQALKWCFILRHGFLSSHLVGASSFTSGLQSSNGHGCTDPPDSITIGEFMRSEIYGRYPIAKSHNPFTCGLTGKTFTVEEAHNRSDLIAKALGKIMGWEPNADLAWDKVVGIFSFNTVIRLQ